MPAAKKAVEEILPDRRLFVWKTDGSKPFYLTVPHNAQITYGPWAPPTMIRSGSRNGMNPIDPAKLAGTLRIYGKTKTVALAVIPHVGGFFDAENIEYQEVEASLLSGVPSNVVPAQMSAPEVANDLPF